MKKRTIEEENVSNILKEGLKELSIPHEDYVETALEKYSKGKYVTTDNKSHLIFIDIDREDRFSRVSEAVRDIVTALLTGGNEEENIKRMKLCDNKSYDIYTLGSILYTFGAGDRKLNTLIKLNDWLNKE